MGFGRFLKKTLIPGYYQIEIAKQISDNGVKDGIKEIIKQDIEDTPVVSQIYNAGKYEGKKEGYNKASYEYEEKLLKQAELFLKEKDKFSKERESYEKLIDDYESYIESMTYKEDLSEEEQKYLNKIIIMERKLTKVV